MFKENNRMQLVDAVATVLHMIQYADKHISDIVQDDFRITACVRNRASVKMVRSYSPNIFAHIRRLDGISSEIFMSSWPIKNLDKNWKTSTGRSGSAFYVTPDKKFFLKTLKSDEKDTMKQILEDYHDYMQRYTWTFLMHVYGLFKVTISGFHTYYFILFGSILPPNTRLDCIYDLKGRTPKKGKTAKERGVISKGARKEGELDRQICFDDIEVQTFFLKQLENDTKFLSSHNLMDYSLLIGIKKITNKKLTRIFKFTMKDAKKQDSERKRKIRMNKLGNERIIGGFAGSEPNSSDSNEMYYVGIIDFLTQYTFCKKVAHFFKSLIWEDSSISTVEPNYYARRLNEFVATRLINEDIHT